MTVQVWFWKQNNWCSSNRKPKSNLSPGDWSRRCNVGVTIQIIIMLCRQWFLSKFTRKQEKEPHPTVHEWFRAVEGVHITGTLTWSVKTSRLGKKAQQRIHFLGKMKRTAVSLSWPTVSLWATGTVPEPQDLTAESWKDHQGVSTYQTPPTINDATARIVDHDSQPLPTLHLSTTASPSL